MQHLEKIKYFQCVAKHRSIRQAALNLRISQPSVSRAIQILEETLACTLFQRTNQGVALTEAGEEFSHFCDETLNAAEKIERRLALLQGKISGTLRIGTYHPLVPVIYPILRKTISSDFKDLQFEVIAVNENSELLRQIIHHQVDAAILAEPQDFPMLETKKIYVETYGFFCRRQGHFQSLNQLEKNIPLLYMSSAICGRRKTLQEELWSKGMLIAPVINEMTLDTVLAFLLRDTGVAILPWRIAYDLVKNQFIAPLRIRGFSSGLGSHAIYLCCQKSFLRDARYPVLRMTCQELKKAKED